MSEEVNSPSVPQERVSEGMSVPAEDMATESASCAESSQPQDMPAQDNARQVADVTPEHVETGGAGEQPAAPEENGEAETGGASVAQEPDPVCGEAAPERETENRQGGEDISEAASSTVGFADEEAELAASAPEFELGEEDESERSVSSDDRNMLDRIPGLNKAELVELFASLLEERSVQTLRYEIEAIKIAFYKLLRAEHEQARKRFVEAGGAPEEFMPSADADEARLKELFGIYRRKREEYMSNLERTKEDNLKIKLKIIEDLKELAGGNETLNHTFNAFRELQQRWRETGVVPQEHVKDIWETYNLHVENFYNYIKINKELRDLDLRRNYEAKIGLCEAAEALALEPSVVTAFRKLQDLHERWRETGPVAVEYKDAVWERFKEASSRINRQHQEYFEGIKEEQRRNLELKTELCVKAEELCGDILTSRRDWNKASDKLIEIQKVWKTLGFAPKRDKAKIYERFRTACDHFFELKRKFYEQVRAEMENNLQQKLEICAQAEALADSEQWRKTTDELIALQKRWKEIGPVSRRQSEAVWKRFRGACDRFFDRKTAHFAGKDAEHEDNMQRKLALLSEIEACDIAAEGGFDKIKEFQRRWGEIGYVPIKQKEELQRRYREQIDRLFATLRGGARERSIEGFRNRITDMKTSGDRRVRFERDRLYAKVRQYEAEIALLENNIGFFSKSKNAEAMINDVRSKIEKTRADMAAAIEKINLIDKEGM